MNDFVLSQHAEEDKPRKINDLPSQSFFPGQGPPIQGDLFDQDKTAKRSKRVDSTCYLVNYKGETWDAIRKPDDIIFTLEPTGFNQSDFKPAMGTVAFYRLVDSGEIEIIPIPHMD